MTPLKLLIVDDSFFMRQALEKILNVPEIEIIDTAKNGKEAVEKVLLLQPDIVTMDIEMPVMTGIDALREIMATFPVPVIMVSSLTSDGAEATMDALSLGAVDFIAKKPAFREMDLIRDELVKKILDVGNNQSLRNHMIRKRLLLQMAKSKHPESNIKTQEAKTDTILKQHSKEFTIHTGRKRPKIEDIKVIGIGISTGGPNALQELLKRLPGKLPVPVLISQHMPAFFTKSLAARLNGLSQLNVKEAQEGDRITAGNVYLAEGGKHLLVTKAGTLKITEEPQSALYKPSVDVMISSMVDVYSNKMIGIIMTGMGHDGRDGLKKLHEAGGYIMAQDPDSCVIAGMPKSVIEANIADEIHSLANLPIAISTCFGLSAVPPII